MTGHKLWLLILPILVAVAVLVWFYPSNSDFRVENPSWNGARDFVTEFEALTLDSLDALPATSQGTTLVIIPYLKFNLADLQNLEDYVTSGGRLIVLDDYGFGNDILEYLGLKTRFSGTQLLDPLFNYKNSNFPKIIDFDPGLATSGVESIIFNHATSMDNIPQDKVMAWSSPFSFLDENQSSEWDEGEMKGPFPVAAKFEIGKGDFILIADPSILISSMVNIDDNRQFLKNIAEGQILLDQSHLPEAALDEAKRDLQVTHTVLASIGGSLGLIVLILALTLRPIWHKREQNDYKKV